MTASKVILEVHGYQPPPGAAYGGEVSCVDKFIRRNVQNGVADGEFSILRCLNQQIAAGATVNLDLQTDTDRYGVALGATDVRLGYIGTFEQDSVGAPAQGTLAIEPNSTNGWDSLIGSSGATDRGRIVLPYDSFVCFGCERDGAIVVDGTTKALDLIETTTTDAVDVQLQFWVTQ